MSSEEDASRTLLFRRKEFDRPVNTRERGIDDEGDWLVLSRKVRRRTLLGQLPSVRRTGNTLIIGVNRMAGCFGIGAFTFTAVAGICIYLQNPHDPHTQEFLQRWFLIGGGIGLIGCVAGFARTGLYCETAAVRLIIRYGLLHRRWQFTVADLSADLLVAEKRFGSSVPAGHVVLVLRHKAFNEVVPLASAPTQADLKLALVALTEILGRPPSDRMTEVMEMSDGESISISRASCSSGSANYRTHVFRDLSSDEGMFRPTLRAYLVAGLVLAVALAALGFMLPSAILGRSILGAAISFVVGGVFLLFGWMLVPPRIRIVVNRSARTIRITGVRQGLEASDDPLSLRDIVAVQICSRRESGRRSYQAYELNLVLKNPDAHRINLMCHSNRRALCDDAQLLADFLGKPLLDHSVEESSRRGP